MEVTLTPHPRRDLAPVLGITNLSYQLLVARALSVTPPFQRKSTGMILEWLPQHLELLYFDYSQSSPRRDRRASASLRLSV